MNLRKQKRQLSTKMAALFEKSSGTLLFGCCRQHLSDSEVSAVLYIHFKGFKLTPSSYRGMIATSLLVLSQEQTLISKIMCSADLWLISGNDFLFLRKLIFQLTLMPLLFKRFLLLLVLSKCTCVRITTRRGIFKPRQLQNCRLSGKIHFPSSKLNNY